MSTIPKEEPAAALGRIRHLLEQERISEARHLLQVALNAQPQGASNQELLRLRALLAAPEVRKSPLIDADRTKDHQWLATNGAQHRGRWVAIREGELVAEASSLEELLRSVRLLGDSPSPLIHFLE